MRRFPVRGQSLSMGRGDYQMSRVCAWILLLVFRLRVVLWGCASKFRSHCRRRVDFSSGGRAALSLRGRASKFRSSRRCRVDVRRFSRCGTSCASKNSAHEEYK
ncbi:hypothetical protein NDU88_002003 [Pleurodeles waltl]|uniref:Secreted protein n=1 Tax=Pleurodeles waltl TaxID=8319 RepID=A0AAV7SE85_PLEWA|nr:hypothetical protein NDU88_002003 [Pleurodeles waltl]